MMRRKGLAVIGSIVAVSFTLGAQTQVAAPPAAAVATGADVITNSIGMKLKLIQPGTFKMGSPASELLREDNETPIREVTLSKPFYIGVYEMTQAEWAEVMGNNPSSFVGPKRPVETVSWDDVQALLKKLSEKEGAKYRLPTEAEWEYACRAGSLTAYYWGDSWNDEYGWCNRLCNIYSGETTQDVGMKRPNAWGLYDMSGNVYEWCQDWYDKYPATFKDTDPQGASDGESRVLRGGSWFINPALCRSASRLYLPADFRHPFLGFRVVRTP